MVCQAPWIFPQISDPPHPSGTAQFNSAIHLVRLHVPESKGSLPLLDEEGDGIWKETAIGMTTRSVQLCDENLILSSYLGGQVSQLAAPVDAAYKVLDCFWDKYNIHISPWISCRAHCPNICPTSSHGLQYKELEVWRNCMRWKTKVSKMSSSGRI